MAAIAELIGTPEAARELNHDACSGIRIVLEEAAGRLLVFKNMTGYKLLAVATLMDSPERANEIEPDAWSGARIIIEEVAGRLLNV